MSKKLIAVASAAAIALSALVATPAQALLVEVGATAPASASVWVTNDVARSTGTGSQASPIKIVVPDAGTVAASDILKLVVSSTLKRTAITASVSNGIKLLDAPGDATNKYTSASGTTALAAAQTTDAAGAYTFYAFPTSTTAGVITVTIGTDVTQIYVQGTVGRAYDITSVTIPSVEPKATGTATFTVTDAFGNAVGATDVTLTLSRIGGTGGTHTGAGTDVSYSNTTKRFETEVTAPNAAGQVAYAAVVKGLTATTAMTDAFGQPQTYFGLVTFTSTADKVTALTAQVATLTASVAALTADYNSVAKKYNKLVKKSKRVALK
jgi:hypothetical protein